MKLKDRVERVGLRPARMVELAEGAFSLSQASVWHGKLMRGERLVSSVRVMMELMCEKEDEFLQFIGDGASVFKGSGTFERKYMMGVDPYEEDGISGENE